MFKIAVIIIAAIQLCGVSKTFAVEAGVFKGRVFDVEGKAVKGAGIFVYNSSDTRRPADFISAGANEEGQFYMALPAGQYRVVARSRTGEKYGPLRIGDKHSGEPVDLEIEAGRELVMDFTITDIRDAARLAKKTGEDHLKVTGRIVDKNGAPVKMCYVIAEKKGEDTPLDPLLIEVKYPIPDFISAWTDDSGQYTLYLPKGKYYIGYAGKFPPEEHRVYKELIIESDKDKFDIVIGENNTDEKNNY